MIICQLFVNYLLIIWWLFEDYLMIIWCLFDAYLIVIWWLFDLIWWLFDGYSWLFGDYLIIIIRDYLMIIRFPRQQQVVWFASVPKAFTWNSGSSGWWQPFPWAYCSLRVSLATCCRSYASSATTILSFMAVSTCRALCPALPQHLAARGSAPSHHAKFDGILHPDHKSRLRWTRVFSPIRTWTCSCRLLTEI